MPTSLSTSYILPALFLNPILFLHSLNAILARILPPIVVDAAAQPPPYYTRGPSAEHPHLNIHASDSLCWSYTVFMVCAQLVAFGRVSMYREARKERVKRRKLQASKEKLQEIGLNGAAKNKDAIADEKGSWPTDNSRPRKRSNSQESSSSSSSSSSSEVIL